jgi:hypothetical protein
MQRRIIPYNEFRANFSWTDPIKNPYLYNVFFVHNINPAYDSYEFLIWTDDVYRGLRVESPDDAIYNINGNYSNHHIIPIAHLLYLWDYFHGVDPTEEKKLKEQVEQVTHKQVENINQRALKEIARECSTWEDWERNVRRKAEILAEKNERILRVKQEQFELEREAFVSQKYKNSIKYIKKLCPEGRFGRSGFAWSWWNLFKGHSRPFRLDDPADELGSKRNEKNKPRGFDKNIWDSVQALFETIDSLAQAKRGDHTSFFIELQLEHDLKELSDLWSTVQNKKIYKFNPHDWEECGERYGRIKYRVK